VVTPAPSDDHGWISVFLEAQAAERNAARNTRLAYGRDLKDASLFAAARGMDFARLARADVEAYLVRCDAEGLSKATRARRLSALKQLFRFAHEEGWRDDNPALRIAGPGREKRLPKTLSHDAALRLIAVARTYGRSGIERSRNLALLELLYATGLRVTELASLPLSAVLGDPQMILVKGKGGRERLVPLSGPARAAIADWLPVRAGVLADRPHPPAAQRALFPGKGAAGHLTRQQVHTLLRDIAIRAGLAPDAVTPHVLRHAFATALLAGGADLRVIQTLLGHADIATTEIYTHVLDDHLKALVLTHHPLARSDADLGQSLDRPAPAGDNRGAARQRRGSPRVTRPGDLG
jgi:integrase/recombinase XerD